MKKDPPTSSAPTQHRARKRFGQHFLHDSQVVARILASFKPQAQETIVEIGPGLGVLTRELLLATGTLQAVEIDRDLIPRLQQALGTLGNFRLHQADALQVDYRNLATHGEKVRIIGNLPYNISTPLLFHLLEQADGIQDMLFMLQKEVVDRLIAAPGGKDYGRLSVMVQWRSQVEKIFDVHPGAFKPPPKVMSSVVQLTPHRQALIQVDNPLGFSQLVKAAFAQRRKTLRNTLKNFLSAQAMDTLGIDPQRRAETLSLAEFATLSNASNALSNSRERKPGKESD